MDPLRQGERRSQQVLRLAQDFKCLTAGHLSRTIYRASRQSGRLARRKLARLVEQGHLFRWRPYSGHPWVYAERATPKWRHHLWLLELFCRVVEDGWRVPFAVERYEPALGLIPDATLAVDERVLYLEVALNGRLNDRRKWEAARRRYPLTLVVLHPAGLRVSAPDWAIVEPLEPWRLARTLERLP